jgi:hypothetical protein
MPDAPQNPPPPYGGQPYPGSYYPPPNYSQPPKKRKVWPWILGVVVGVFILLLGGCVAFLAVVGKSLEGTKPTVSSHGGAHPAVGDRGPDFPGKQNNDTGARGLAAKPMKLDAAQQKRLLRLYQHGEPVSELTAMFGISRSTRFRTLKVLKQREPVSA